MKYANFSCSLEHTVIVNFKILLTVYTLTYNPNRYDVCRDPDTKDGKYYETTTPVIFYQMLNQNLEAVSNLSEMEVIPFHICTIYRIPLEKLLKVYKLQCVVPDDFLQTF